MFEIFTMRGRQVIEHAKQEALYEGDDCVGTQHILYGLIKEGSGVGANILTKAGLSCPQVREESNKIVQKGEGAHRNPAFSPRANNLFNQAVDEAKKLKHRYVGTEHILLALLLEKESIAIQILLNLKHDPKKLYEETMALLGYRYVLHLISDDVYSVTLDDKEVTRYDRNSHSLLMDKPMHVGELEEIIYCIRNHFNDKE